MLARLARIPPTAATNANAIESVVTVSGFADNRCAAAAGVIARLSTKSGSLSPYWVKDTKIRSLEEIYLFSLSIKESEIFPGGKTDFSWGHPSDETLKNMPVQKQTPRWPMTRFKAFVAFRDYIGLGVQCSKHIAMATHGAIILGKLSIIHV